MDTTNTNNFDNHNGIGDDDTTTSRTMSDSNINNPMLCQTLDELTVQLMETLNLISTLRQQLDQELSSGFISIAKSRYSMGNKSVTALQHDTRELEAITRIVGESPSDFELINLPTLVEVNVEKKIENNVGYSAENSSDLRHRRKKKESLDENVSLLNDDGDSNGYDRDTDQTFVEKKMISRDPLKMFGLLVPQSMRQAKNSFQRLLGTACLLVKAQDRLASVQNEYRNLMDQKLSTSKSEETRSLKKTTTA